MNPIKNRGELRSSERVSSSCSTSGTYHVQTVVPKGEGKCITFSAVVQVSYTGTNSGT
jgi:hypothetical protein